MTQTSSLTETDFSERMADLVSQLASMLVDSPERVRVELDDTTEESIIRLFVAPDDIGKVIGKQGRTARSLRTILMAAASKSGRRFSLDVLEG